MNLLALKRKLALFSSMDDLKLAPDVLFQNKVLILALLPTSKLVRVLFVASLLVLAQDKSLLISGKKIGLLVAVYGQTNYQIAIHGRLNYSTPPWSVTLMQTADFGLASAELIVNLLYPSYPELRELLLLRIQEQIKQTAAQLSEEALHFWRSINLNCLVAAVFRALELCCPQTMLSLVKE